MADAVEVQRLAGNVLGTEFYSPAGAAAAVSTFAEETSRSMTRLRKLANKVKHGSNRGGAGAKRHADSVSTGDDGLRAPAFTSQEAISGAVFYIGQSDIEEGLEITDHAW